MIILLFIGLILFNAKIMDKDYEKTALNYSNTVAIRGICAIEIMLGHIGIALPNQILLFPFRKAGILIVGIFFFFSGYGLMYSLENKKNYLTGFLRKRLTAILVPTFFVCILAILLYYAILGENNSILQACIFSIESINWYVWEILGCYVLFYLVYRFLSKESAFVFIAALSVIFVCFSYIAGLSNPWYGSTLCFPLGLWAASNQTEFLKWNVKHWIGKTAVLGIVLSVSIILFFILPERSISGAIISRNVASLSFCCIVTILLRKIKIGNKLTEFLGKISFEIYLVHPLVISIYLSNRIQMKNDILYTIAVIGTSIFSALALNKIVSLFRRPR